MAGSRPPGDRPPPPHPFMKSLHSSARAMPSRRRPTTINVDIACNLSTSIPGQDIQPSSSNGPNDRAVGGDSFLYSLRLMTAAPPPRIRTEENSPPPELSALVNSGIGRPSTSSRPPQASKEEEFLNMSHIDRPALHAENQNAGSGVEAKTAAQKGAEKQKETKTKAQAKAKTGKEKAKKKRYSSGESDFEEYLRGMAERAKNPPTFIGPKEYPGKPLPETLAGAGEWDKMLWTWKLQGAAHKDIEKEWERLTGEALNRGNLLVRFCRLKEQFAVSGELDFTDKWLRENPKDRKYQIISERKRNKIKSNNARTIKRIDQEEHREKVSCRSLNERRKGIASDAKPCDPYDDENNAERKREEGKGGSEKKEEKASRKRLHEDSDRESKTEREAHQPASKKSRTTTTTI